MSHSWAWLWKNLFGSIMPSKKTRCVFYLRAEAGPHPRVSYDAPWWWCDFCPHSGSSGLPSLFLTFHALMEYYDVMGGCPSIPIWPKSCPSGSVLWLSWPYQCLRTPFALWAIFGASLLPCSHTYASQMLLLIHFWRGPKCSFWPSGLNLCMGLSLPSMGPFILAIPLNPGPGLWLLGPSPVLCSRPLLLSPWGPQPQTWLVLMYQPPGSLTPGAFAFTVSALSPLDPQTQAGMPVAECPKRHPSMASTTPL